MISPYYYEKKKQKQEQKLPKLKDNSMTPFPYDNTCFLSTPELTLPHSIYSSSKRKVRGSKR